jgi:hypothetical protein
VRVSGERLYAQYTRLNYRNMIKTLEIFWIVKIEGLYKLFLIMNTGKYR